MVAIRRAGPCDRAVLVSLIREFCAIDHHPFDLERVRRAVEPLLADDMHGQIWLIIGDAAADVDGYAVMTWATPWSPAGAMRCWMSSTSGTEAWVSGPLH